MLSVQNSRGFTIVELIVVIVVIAILASITLVSYVGIRDRAYDASVVSDLSNVSKMMMIYSLDNGDTPKGSAQLSELNLSLSTNAYSRGYYNGSSWYNVVSCWPSSGDSGNFALIAESKSGNVFEAKNGSTRQVEYELTGSTSVCQDAGVPIANSSSRDWFYNADAWQSYVGGQ